MRTAEIQERSTEYPIQGKAKRHGIECKRNGESLENLSDDELRAIKGGVAVKGNLGMKQKSWNPANF